MCVDYEEYRRELHALAQSVANLVEKGGMEFPAAFKQAFAQSILRDEERTLEYQKAIGNIVKTRGQQKHLSKTTLRLLAGAQQMSEEAHEQECPLV